MLPSPCWAPPASHTHGQRVPGGPGCCPLTQLLPVVPRFRAFSQPWCRPHPPVDPTPLAGPETLPGLPPLRVGQCAML